MKIAIIDPSCFTPQYDHALCNAISNQGCEVIFFGSRYLYEEFYFRSNYIKTNLFYNFTNRLYHNKPNGFLRAEIKGIEHLKNMYELKSFLKKIKPSIIHFQWMPLPFVDKYFIKSLKTIAPCILTLHDVFPYQNAPSSKIQLLNFSNALKDFDHLIVHTSSAFKKIIEEFNIPECRISIVPHGIFEHYKQQVIYNTDSDDYNSIVFFGTLKPYKGLDILIEAYARLPLELQKKYKLVIAGVPKMNLCKLKDLAEKVGVDKNIEWHLGFIPENKVGAILNKAVIFVLPYRFFEAQSGALMAMLPFSRPFIVTNIESFREILKDGVHGYLVEPNDVTSLTSALNKILSDPQKLKTMADSVSSLLNDEFSWDKIACKTIKIYRNLIKNG